MTFEPLCCTDSPSGIRALLTAAAQEIGEGEIKGHGPDSEDQHETLNQTVHDEIHLDAWKQ